MDDRPSPNCPTPFLHPVCPLAPDLGFQEELSQENEAQPALWVPGKAASPCSPPTHKGYHKAMPETLRHRQVTFGTLEGKERNQVLDLVRTVVCHVWF